MKPSEQPDLDVDDAGNPIPAGLGESRDDFLIDPWFSDRGTILDQNRLTVQGAEIMDRLEIQQRTLQLARQEAMDLRVALVECVEVIESYVIDASVGATAVLHARVALGVANPLVLPGEDCRQPD